MASIPLFDYAPPVAPASLQFRTNNVESSLKLDSPEIPPWSLITDDGRLANPFGFSQIINYFSSVLKGSTVTTTKDGVTVTVTVPGLLPFISSSAPIVAPSLAGTVGANPSQAAWGQVPAGAAPTGALPGDLSPAGVVPGGPVATPDWSVNGPGGPIVGLPSPAEETGATSVDIDPNLPEADVTMTNTLVVMQCIPPLSFNRCV